MIDYDAVRNTIANETSVELLRGVVVMVLGEIEQRRQALNKIDPILEPGFKAEESRRTTGVLGQTHDLEVMRALARDAFKGLESLDVQLARARTP